MNTDNIHIKNTGSSVTLASPSTEAFTERRARRGGLRQAQPDMLDAERRLAHCN